MSSDNIKDRESATDRNLRWQGYISEIGQDNETALAQFYDESKALVYSLALKTLNDQPDAEEVTLDVFKNVWINASKYESGRSNPTTWLIMMTRSRSIDKIRSRKSIQEVSDIIEKEIASTGSSTDSATLESEQRKIVLAALSELNSKQRQVVELAYFYQYTQTEIASKLDIPVGSVKSTIRLATEKLKKTLTIIK